MLGIRPDDLLFLVMLTVGVAGLGWFVRLNWVANRRARWIAWLTYGLTVGAVFAAGFVGLLLGWTPGKEWLGLTVAGGGFGFFTGLWGGRFVWRYYQKELFGDEDAR
jgi:hypothetical protein